ncbi:peptidoglycan N-acetylglucosamine deacetylase [Bacillus cereus BAG1X2-3]|uniref:Polysaccharide deacetylase n=1 Tax=Bacillus cereus TaxID=1396 RepID=A0A9X7E7D0_BACCE|nr:MULTISPECIES: polysaccharide deacetylase family protein [Bacillus]EOO28598.1 peptidoglycan N-acetylglucosamine deacetylase [Bacillus cereus BAG1X1-1]EOO48331.1 peptidoglycan N-acetylglucosamine deacetylase [Bacillus cereus BAG1X2-1]EOO53350.1 peptidoglycan N-acetylglucosamine deacetylase [Bacillus cereus BAG1X2-2]EOO59200.1 peptidoglycan N-acetylglucosamine deacetylase [Bacillus cereus BAG1X2-3]EOP04918.1 peptidoglycan N-acetylglucosamine deacetylase [Bacillus cereus BAG2O-1]
MKESQNKKKTNVVTKAILSLGVVLATTFFMFFLIGKWNAIPAKGVANESIKLANTQQQEKKEDTSLAKQKRPDGKPVGKVVYLTFDDGPSELTGEFLDVLKEQNVVSTFFMQGSNLQNTSFQENVKRAVKEGHYIGAHSMTHNSDKLYKKGQFVPEMKETLALIHNITGTTPKLVRPPYGSAPGLKGQEIRNQIVEAGIKVWDWTIDSNDWKLKGNPQQIIENVKRTTTEDVEVVLMHEKPQTLQALPEIIKFYKEKGYEFGVYNEADHFQLNFQKDQRL